MPIPCEKLKHCSIRYDLVILIKVIEHCYDIQKVLNNILENSSGYIVFLDKIYNHNEVLKSSRTIYDAAHPLRVDRKILENLFSKNFHTVFRAVKKNAQIIKKTKLEWDEIAYIGKKK